MRKGWLSSHLRTSSCLLLLSLAVSSSYNNEVFCEIWKMPRFSMHRTLLAFLLSLTAARSKKSQAIVRKVIEDLHLPKGRYIHFLHRIEKAGIDVASGDTSFLLDFNETTDEDFARAGIKSATLTRLRAAVSARTPQAQHTRFDALNAYYINSGLPVQRLYARLRLLRYRKQLYWLGVAQPCDLVELRAGDTLRMGMSVLERRRVTTLQREIAPCSPKGTQTFTGPRTFIDQAAADFLVGQVRLDSAMVKILDRLHGVESLVDLRSVTDELLQDVGGRELHRRRFHSVITGYPVPVLLANVSCGSSVRDALVAARLERFAETLRTSGAQTASHLLELRHGDLMSCGLRSLHRTRFYQLVSQLASVCRGDGNGAKQRQALRRSAYSRAAGALRNTLPAPTKLGPPAPILGAPVRLFNESVQVIAGGGAASWSIWSPTRMPPQPAQHPMGLDCWMGQLRLPGGIVQEMCLNPKDHLSTQLQREGRWRDCAELVSEWNKDPSRGIFLELGANIGACTLEMLLLTSARIVAFEPSPVNLFHLTRSLSLAATRAANDDIASRVVVFPIGAGDASSRSTMFNEKGNFGDSRIGTQTAELAAAAAASHRQFDGISQNIDVYTLDEVFQQVKPVHLMKLDIQGFECRALQGATSLLLSGSVKSIIAETSKVLKRQLCTRKLLRDYLRAAGYRIVSQGGQAKGPTTESSMVAHLIP